MPTKSNVRQFKMRAQVDLKWTRWFVIFKFDSNDATAGYYQIIASLRQNISLTDPPQRPADNIAI